MKLIPKEDGTPEQRGIRAAGRSALLLHRMGATRLAWRLIAEAKRDRAQWIASTHAVRHEMEAA